MVKQDYAEKLRQLLCDFNQYSSIGGFTDKTNTTMSNYLKTFLLNNPDLVLPPILKNCKCTHWIQVNCYIVNDLTREIITIGNCCINKFAIKHKCATCNKVFKRYKNAICTDCEKAVKKEISDKKKADRQLKKTADDFEKLKKKADKQKFKFGKHKHSTFGHVASTNDQSYFKWCWNKNNYEPNNMFEPVVEYYEKYMMM